MGRDGRDITDEMLDAYTVTGTYDDIIDKIRKKYDGYLDRIAFYFPVSRDGASTWREIVRSFNG